MLPEICIISLDTAQSSPAHPSPELHQGQTLIANCASAATAIAKLLKRLQKIEKNKGDQNGRSQPTKIIERMDR
ncbi:hypothetical protein [Xanthomonas citri]|uniref:hypothetical protein n=1 Tax=Xanthomonas citri TaxID=346 RepID=UPI00052D8EEB|nr:hypothetical protein [Xanthomonas citri]CEE39078.1 hypothetical protein XAC2911_360004 [Xanthomonas citri pv. citri]CEH49778.1 hypothetical protein XAC3615_14050010 [Xanthomonas citri pv. citri]CEH94980.1 hypothetical protein XAC3607_4310014 [Xanthomonas citri pv. citri]